MAAYGTVSQPGRIESGLETKEKEVDEDGPRGCLEHCAPYLAEFVGTFLIVFTMGISDMFGDPRHNGTGIAFMVTIVVYSVAPISGAHLNPAVTLARFLCFKFSWTLVFGYVLAQVAGGMLGSIVYTGIFYGLEKPVKLHDQSSWLEIGIVELLYTFVLCFVVLNCMDSVRNNKKDDQNHFFALAIGFVYIAGFYPCQSISGGIFNPAASLAIGITGKTYFEILVYVLAQAAGAWAAATAFPIVRPEDYKMQYDGPLEEFVVPIRSKTMAELIGSFVIAMTVGLNTVRMSVAGPWSSAAAYICMIYALGDVSGGHFNPAVTLAAVLSRRNIISIPMGQNYVIQQLLSGVAAGLLYEHFSIVKGSEKRQVEADALSPYATFDWGESCGAEVCFTGLLAFAYLAAVTSTMPPSLTKTNFYFGFVVGACVAISGFSIGAITGGKVNPVVAVAQAVAFARRDLYNDLSIPLTKMLGCLWFSLSELGGGIAAAIVFTITHQREYLKDKTNFPHIP